MPGMNESANAEKAVAQSQAGNVAASGGNADIVAAKDTGDVKANLEDSADVKAIVAKALDEERSRIAGIKAACNGEFADIEAQAIDEKWTVAKVNAKVLEAIRAKRPAVGPQIDTGAKAIGNKEIEAALCLRLGFSPDDLAADKRYGEQVVDAAEGIAGISLKEVIHECIRAEGGTPSRIGLSNDDIKAGFSTVSLPGILSNVANKSLMRSFNAVQPVAYRMCSIGSLNDFKEIDRYRMTDLGDLQPVAPDGEIKDSGFTEEHARMSIDTYGTKFVVTRKMLINDDLGVFNKVPAMMGAKAARLVDQLFFARLLANPVQEDGQALFSAAHRNLVSSGGAFGKEALQNAITLFESQVDAADRPIALTAKYLLIASKLKFAARELLNSAQMIVAGQTDRLVPAYNVLADSGLEIISTPHLASEADNWYLFGNPSEIDTFEIGFLNGKRTPTVEKGETDYNTLGMWFRVYWDLGIREQEFRGMVKSIG